MPLADQVGARQLDPDHPGPGDRPRTEPGAQLGSPLGHTREAGAARVAVRRPREIVGDRQLAGVAGDVEPDLDHFSGIVPCGISGHGVTSLVDLGLPVTLDDADAALKASFNRVFGPGRDAPAPA